MRSFSNWRNNLLAVVVIIAKEFSLNPVLGSARRPKCRLRQKDSDGYVGRKGRVC
jgi:hypothetical protein